MKAVFEKPKNQRVKRNYSFIDVRLPGGYRWGHGIIFDSKGYPYYLNEQDDRSKAGLPSAFDTLDEYTRDNSERWLRKGKSFKAAVRAVNQMKPYLPTGAVIRVRNRWIRHDVKFNVNNPNPVPTNTDFVLRSGYSRLTGSDVNFDNLVVLLRAKGYLVEVKLEVLGKYHDEKIYGPWTGDFYAATFTGNNITGAFSQVSTETNPNLSGKVCAQYYDNFNKWSQVPIKMLIPTNDEEMTAFIAALDEEAKDLTRAE